MDVQVIPTPDAPAIHCALGDQTDPVLLCMEKELLRVELENAYTPGRGLASTFDSATGATSGHSWQDDLGLASTISSYQCSAGYYGDEELDGTLATIRADLARVLTAELPKAPDAYDGEVYFRLRNAATGYYEVNETANARRLAQLADDYGRAIQTTYAHAVPALASGDADGGSGGGVDGGAPSVILGVPGGAGIAYEPAQVAMGAAALLDMATLHAGDAGAEPAVWQQTAIQALSYIWRRARDPVTGLFYQSLVTSGDPDHDALASAQPASDALLTDVQATIIMGLARAQERFNALAAAGGAGADAGASQPTSAYLKQADTIVGALLTANLWDGALSPGAAPGAFFEGLLPSVGAALTNKTTLGNAYLLGGVVRILTGSSTNNAFVDGHLIAAFVQSTAPHTNFLSALTNAQDQVVQQGYLRATSRDFGLAVAFAPDGGPDGQEPGATNYRTDALAAVIEGFVQRWRERPNPPPCGM
jgi:hypothetical protein